MSNGKTNSGNSLAKKMTISLICGLVVGIGFMVLREKMIGCLLTSMIVFPCSGYGIVSALVKRMTAQDPFESQPAALDGAVFLNGLQRVLGAGGDIVAAGRKTGRDASSIEPDHPQHQLFHACSSKRSNFRHSFKNVLFSSFQGAVAVLPRATRMIS